VAESASVLVDSSVWIGFFGGDARAIGMLTALKDAHRIVICGQIKQEVLQGSRDAKALARVEREMAIWDYEAEQPADFVAAASLYANLRSKGTTIPAADCLISAVAKRCDMRVCAIDPHFERVPCVRLYAAGPK
jgi:predicted nucleic acid-binding protein